jgi:hypothetical protein
MLVNIYLAYALTQEFSENLNDEPYKGGLPYLNSENFLVPYVVISSNFSTTFRFSVIAYGLPYMLFTSFVIYQYRMLALESEDPSPVLIQTLIGRLAIFLIITQTSYNQRHGDVQRFFDKVNERVNAAQT